MTEITKAPFVKEPIILKRDNDVEKYKMKFEEVLDPYPDRWKLNFFEKMSVWIEQGAKYSKVILIIINLIIKIGGKMSEKTPLTNDQKTTRTGIVKLILSALAGIVTIFFGTEISPEAQNVILGAILGVWGVVELIQGYFTNKKD